MDSAEEQRHCNMLNNLGVDIMRCGNYDLAITAFRECMAIARNALKRGKGEQQKLNENLQASKESRDSETCVQLWFSSVDTVFDQQPVPAHETISAMELDEEKSLASFFICRSPITIPEDHSASCVTPIHAVVAMFNMALCYHIYGLEGGLGNDNIDATNPSYELLSTSASLYRLCEEMVYLDGIGASPLFCMTLANNLGSVHSTMGSNDQALYCFRYLLSIQMMYVSSSNKHGPNHNVEALNGFWSNTARLILNNCTAPAA